MPVEQISRLTPGECEVAVEQLQSLTAVLQTAQALMQDGQEIWVFRKPSLMTVLKRIPPFQAELEASFRQIQLGNPYGPKTTKGRKTAGKSAPKRKTTKKKSG